MKKILLTCLLFTGTIAFSQSKGFKKFTKDFVTQYQSLNIPGLELSYIANLENIKNADSVQLQFLFFSAVQNDLKKFDRSSLNKNEKDEYDLISYEAKLNLERIDLEKKWIAEKQNGISKNGLFTLPNGKQWYAYFLKRWIAAEVLPDEIYAFGVKEVERIKKNIQNIRIKTGMSEKDFYHHLEDSSFFLSNQKDIQAAFENVKETIYKNLSNIFNVQQIPEVKITKGTNEALANTPGYYTGNTFYYNYFNKPYNKRQVDWLFIHEAVPGHHYQSSIARQVKQSDVHKLFYYLGFSEGWGAYAEELGKGIGVYKTIYDELGKYEWDIVRAVRVPLDVALNYYGWSDEQALAFWKKNITGQDMIAMREIARMRRWPAQVITYKYGAAQIMQWKEELKNRQKEKFDIRAFHDKVLNNGSLPFFIVKRNVLGE